MAKRLSVLCALVPLFVMAGEVQTFPAKGVDLSAYKTYQMLPARILTATGVIENDPDIGPLIAAALRKQLSGKGLTEQSGGAGLQVAAGALTVSVPQIEALIYNMANDASWGSSPLVTIGRYNKEGTLIVNLIDPSTNKSVWLGVSKRALGKPSTREKDINKAAEAMFKKYPSLK